MELLIGIGIGLALAASGWTLTKVVTLVEAKVEGIKATTSHVKAVTAAVVANPPSAMVSGVAMLAAPIAPVAPAA